ncbi:hypothetical protein L6164_030611 [Bauhinia variegata]|uniref:Uncharacterized protein n=1 Tax=Bauhinia variegata TaxID=167791 RepID=A0ACB9LCV8_BAUVA|nr:hypothetical protein L6164_030611 [Bauhinia variegata]
MERSKIQVLCEACHSIFSQEELLTFKQIQCLKKFLDRIEAIDVGIDEFGLGDSPISSRGLLSAQGFSEITYIHIHECNSFSMGVFCLPAGKVFPLHDHPEMTVFTKLLYGSMHVKAYDWIKLDNTAACPTSAVAGLASCVTDGIMKAPHESTVLFPRSGGNIHTFTSLTPCAILDVLSPPYSEDSGRPSTYFSDFPIPSLPGYAVLEARPLPDDLIVEGAPYLGPPIVEDDNICEFGFRNYA